MTQPMHHAANNNQEALVNILSSVEGQLSEKTEAGNTPLHLYVSVPRNGPGDTWAREEGEIAPVAFYRACARGLVALVSAMLENGANPNALNAAGQNPLHVAVMHGFESLVAPLAKLECQIDCADQKGNTPLHYAALCGFPDVAQALKAHSAKAVPNRVGKEPQDVATVPHQDAYK